LVHRFTEEQNRLKAELATAQAALSETETLIVDALHRAGIEEAEFDQARAQQAEDLASAIAAVEKQALDDAQLGGTLETLQAESSMVGAELERTLARHVEQSARRERLQQRLDETQALWRLRQAELKVAMELHKKTTAAAKIELQQIREAEDAATNRRRAAKAEVKGLESKVNEVRDRCTAASKEIDASKARTQKNRRAGEQCEAEMKRIAAEHARAEEAFDAAIKRRKDLEEKLTTIQVEHNQEELRLTNKLQTVEKRHADLQVREAAASGGIAEVEAEMAANTSASQKVMAHLAWEQGAADVMMQDAKVALDEARAKLVTAENDKRVQLEQSATLLALLENEQKVWDKKRSALLAPLHKLEIEITGHEDLIKSMPFRRISCIKATVAAENAIVVAEEMRKKCTTEITALEQKCEVLSNEIEVATAAADGDDHNRFETDNRRETTVEAHAVWKVNAIEETADLGPATTHLVVTNAEVATSYEAWHTVLVAVKELFGSSFKEFMDAHTQMRDTQRLLTTQIRVRNSLRTMYRRADAQKLEQAVLATLNGGASGRDESTMLRRIVGRLAKVTASHT
jgi:chromosome segregation ATPase